MRANKRLGQHFLVDRGAVLRIVEALRPSREDSVLEIGPGRGALTAELVRRCERIAAVELDARWVEFLRQRFDDTELRIIHGDVLRLDFSSVSELLGRPAGRLLVVGNLPYNVSKPVVAKLVSERRDVAGAVLMFQKEVAARLVARPGTRAYGPMTVLTALTYRVRVLFHLPGSAFRPRPKVESTVTAWTPLAPDGLHAALEAPLRRCLAASFARRRKTLRNNLRAALGSADRVAALLQDADLDGGLRAEAIPVEGFVRLARAWSVA